MGDRMIAVAAFFAVMISALGIAAADQMNVFDKSTNTEVSSINIPVGGGVSLDLVASAFLREEGTAHRMEISVLDSDGKPTSGLHVEVNGKTGTFDWNQSVKANSSEKFNLEIRDEARVKKEYLVRIGDSVSGVQVSKVTVGVEVLPPVSVPEFPTVALPVAAIMGLVFFFQNRKGKEE